MTLEHRGDFKEVTEVDHPDGLGERLATGVMGAAEILAGQIPRAIVLSSDTPHGLAHGLVGLLESAIERSDISQEWTTFFSGLRAELAGMSGHSRTVLLDAILWGNKNLKQRSINLVTGGCVTAWRQGDAFYLVANADQFAPTMTVVGS